MANKTMHHLVIEDNNYEIFDQKARQMVASEYDATKTYHIGDLVVYDGKLLRCTAEITTPEAYNLNHWTYFTVKDALDNLEQGNVITSCDTAENDLNKTAMIFNYDRPNYAPKWFGIVAIRFVNAVKANSTLNINNTGARAIYKGTAPITDGVIKAGDTALFMLNGVGRYVFLGSDTYGDKIDSLTADVTTLKEELSEKADLLHNVVSGTIARFPDGADDIPVKDLTVDIEPVQDLHGYDHPYPAEGGKNKFALTVEGIKAASGGSWSGNSITINGITFTIITDDAGTVTGINANGQASGNAILNIGNATFLSSASSGTYTLNGCPVNGSSNTYNIDVAGMNGCDSGIGRAIEFSDTITNTAVRVRVLNNITVNNLLFKPMIRLTSVTDGTFAPYSNICPISGWTGANITVNGDIIEVDWTDEAGTVYGGSLDVTTGVLTVDMIKIIADGTSVKTSGGYGALGADWLPAIVLSLPGKNSTTVDNLKASYLKTSPNVQQLEDSIAIGNGGRVIVLHIGTMQGTDGTHGYNSADAVHAAVNAYLRDNNLEICYRLETPTTYQLDPVTIATLLGNNEIFADCGNSIVDYYIDTALYIQKFTAPTEDLRKDVLNSRHIKSGSAVPLTLLHFSDLHADNEALNRILTDAINYDVYIDDKICTGDMTANTYEQISSWWPEDVMTCIGNHDTASYSGGSYNWTALSMANRDAYYIAPFESNWSITHTSGTSYYYKDYFTQKIRLIVMDVMLYTDNGSEATAQTAWLEGLLSDAITNNLHVLIAIHAPHGGATAEVCSFSRYGQGTMPTYSDCNTPQTVIDAVATKIASGLKFIGYLVGHTHQDNVWDAENDGKQLMYCITCAAVAQKAQWEDSDQFRNDTMDAYNLVTIDTANTLVKIVRCGGADIDNHMRTRKAICFNYSTGEKVGEVL